MLAALGSVQAVPLAQGDAPFCAPDQSAQFVFGIAALHERLGTPMGAAEMLSQARQIAAAEARNSFLSKATAHRQQSEQLQREAADASSRALPIVVN